MPMLRRLKKALLYAGAALALLLALALLYGAALQTELGRKALASEALVQTDTGWVQGWRLPGHSVFVGIPYAQAPVGDLRWAAPQPAAAWPGSKLALLPKAICAQPAVPELRAQFKPGYPLGEAVKERLPLELTGADRAELHHAVDGLGVLDQSVVAEDEDAGVLGVLEDRAELLAVDGADDDRLRALLDHGLDLLLLLGNLVVGRLDERAEARRLQLAMRGGSRRSYSLRTTA